MFQRIVGPQIFLTMDPTGRDAASPLLYPSAVYPARITMFVSVGDWVLIKYGAKLNLDFEFLQFPSQKFREPPPPPGRGSLMSSWSEQAEGRSWMDLYANAFLKSTIESLPVKFDFKPIGKRFTSGWHVGESSHKSSSSANQLISRWGS